MPILECNAGVAFFGGMVANAPACARKAEYSADDGADDDDGGHDGDDDGDVDDDGDDGDDDDVRDDVVDDGDGDACDGGDDGDTEFGIGGDAVGASYLLSSAACTTARYTYKPRLTGMPPRLLVQIVGLMQLSPLWC